MVVQLRLTLCNLMDCTPQSSSAHGIFQARILKWAAISYSRRSSNPEVKFTSASPALMADSLPLAPPGKPTFDLRTFLNLQILLAEKTDLGF